MRPLGRIPFSYARRAPPEAGVRRHLHLYDLLYTFTSLSLLVGTHPKGGSEALDHGSVAFTMDTYAYLLPSMRKDAADKLASFILG